MEAFAEDDVDCTVEGLLLVDAVADGAGSTVGGAEAFLEDASGIALSTKKASLQCH